MRKSNGRERLLVYMWRAGIFPHRCFRRSDERALGITPAGLEIFRDQLLANGSLAMCDSGYYVTAAGRRALGRG